MVPETPKIIELDADLAATSELADRRKKALLVGVSSTTGLHTHEDVNLVYNLLAINYDYPPENIVVMQDTLEREGNDLYPTKTNIIRQAQKLVHEARPGDCLVFFFAGHGHQRPCRDGSEEDDLDEYIEVANGQEIKDDWLKGIMVDSLPEGAVLYALFDSCHGGTILDLPHQLKVWTMEEIEILVMRAKGAFKMLHQLAQSRMTGTPSERRKTISFPAAVQLVHSYNPCFSPKPRTSACGRVICVSSTADSQLSFESMGGGSLASALTAVAKMMPNPPLGLLVSHLQRQFAVDQKARVAALEDYLKTLRDNYEMFDGQEKVDCDARCSEAEACRSWCASIQQPQIWSNRPIRSEMIFSP